MSQKDVDNMKNAVSDALKSVRQAAESAADQLDAGLGAVSTGARQGGAFVVNQAGEVNNRLEEVQTTGSAHLESTEHQALSAIRSQVKVALAYCGEYPYAAYAVVATSLLLFPAPRRVIVRNVFGFLQSPESAFRSATESSKALKTSVVELQKTRDTASERATVALEHWTKAHTEAAAAKAELDGVVSKMQSACDEYQGVQETLANLKSKNVLELRTEVSRDLDELKQDLNRIQITVKQMTSKGF